VQGLVFVAHPIYITYIHTYMMEAYLLEDVRLIFVGFSCSKWDGLRGID
jgi:hypothetical protein